METVNLKARRRRNVKEESVSSADLAESSNGEEESKGKDDVGALPNGGMPGVPRLVSPATPVEETNQEKREMRPRSRLANHTEQSEKEKLTEISGSVERNAPLVELRLLACAEYGLVNDETRRKLWPRLLGLNGDEEYTSEENLDAANTNVPDEVYQQILKDVARSGGHLCDAPTEEELKKFQYEMTQSICWVLHRHPQLNYYQGYNDVAATILLVMGLQRSLRILESISLNFLERFMERTMEKVNQELFYIFALLHRVHPTLLIHLENVELFPHFALAEYTTWYAHKYAENRKLLHRLFDFFLGSPPLMPLYVSTVIVAHRDTEIFNTTPDMGHTHKVLCTDALVVGLIHLLSHFVMYEVAARVVAIRDPRLIKAVRGYERGHETEIALLPDDLPFEKLLIDAKNLYLQYPPESIINDVREFDEKRRCKEQEWKSAAEASRRERERLRQLKVAIPSRTFIPYSRLRNYRAITVVTILAIGIYAFLKNGTGLN